MNIKVVSLSVAGVLAAGLFTAGAFFGGVASLPQCSPNPGLAITGGGSSQYNAGDPSLDHAIVSQSQGDIRLAASMWLGSHLESNWKPFSPSDLVNHSYGYYQIQNPADIPPVIHPEITSSQARDAGMATAFMLPAYRLALTRQLQENPGLWIADPIRAAERVAFLAERPQLDYYQTQSGNIPQAWADTLAVMAKNGLSTNFSVIQAGQPSPTFIGVAAVPSSRGAPASPAAVDQNPAGSGCQQSISAGGPVGQPGIVTGDAVTLAKQVLALKGTKIQFIFGSETDFQATANGQLVMPGTGMSCPTRRPVPVSAALSQVILDITRQYSITIGSMVSSHDCDIGRHPMGRAVDINYINGIVITGSQTQFSSANSALYAQFMDYVQSILPRGNWINGQPINMGGIGQQECFSSPRPEIQGLNVFPDACTHIHVDVGVAATGLT